MTQCRPAKKELFRSGLVSTVEGIYAHPEHGFRMSHPGSAAASPFDLFVVTVVARRYRESHIESAFPFAAGTTGSFGIILSQTDDILLVRRIEDERSTHDERSEGDRNLPDADRRDDGADREEHGAEGERAVEPRGIHHRSDHGTQEGDREEASDAGDGVIDGGSDS